MLVKVEEGGGGTWIQVHGPVGQAEAQALFKAAQVLLRKPGSGVLSLDLSAVSYLDSSALGMLLQLHRLAVDLGVDLVLQNPSSAVQRLLQVTNLNRVLRVEGSLSPGLGHPGPRFGSRS